MQFSCCPATYCGALSEEADKWIDETDRELGRRLGQESIANWNYVTNITDENSEKVAYIFILQSSPFIYSYCATI